MQRKIKKLVGIDALLVAGSKKQREKVYQQALDLLNEGKHPVLVLNYEKFKDDFTTQGRVDDDKPSKSIKDPPKYTVANDTWGKDFFVDRNVLFIWDEMPMKLKISMDPIVPRCLCLYLCYRAPAGSSR